MSFDPSHFFGLMPNVTWADVQSNTLATLYMTLVSVAAAGVFGLALGVFLFLTSPKQMLSTPWLYYPLVTVVNIVRAIPFIILIVNLLEYSKPLLGTTMGPTAMLPSLIVGATPFYARLAQMAFKEIDHGVLEAANAMGCNLRHIIFKVLIPEASPALASAMTITTITMIGYTAMAGFTGGGGLGAVAYEGYQRTARDMKLYTTVILVVLVQIVQFIGDAITRRLDKR